MKPTVLVLAASAIVFWALATGAEPSPGAADTEGKEKERTAIAAAEAWLKIVDAGQYAESWTATAAFFRRVVTQEQWVQAMGQVRAPLGDMVSRKVKDSAYKTSLPGSPPGEYVIIQFETAFANKKRAIESVTPMLEADGSWKVSGYFIK